MRAAAFQFAAGHARSLNPRACGLRPLPIASADHAGAPLPGTALLDPQRPLSLERLWQGIGLR